MGYRRPLALDLFCGAGGVCAGLQQAGFEVVGVDLAPQPDYPGTFVLGDALWHRRFDWAQFDFIWASPPCPAYSGVSKWHRLHRGVQFPELIEPTRSLLANHPRTCIENVPEAPLRRDLVLVGRMFGLPIQRKRIFEIQGFEVAPPFFHVPPAPYEPIYAWGDGASNGSIARLRRGRPRATTIDELRYGLGVTHIKSGTLRQQRHAYNNAIPPAYSNWIGKAALRSLTKSGIL